MRLYFGLQDQQHRWHDCSYGLIQMMDINAMTWTGDMERADFDRLPDKCPICHHRISPIGNNLAFIQTKGLRDTLLEIVFRCPSKQCGQFFIARYINASMYASGLVLTSCAPYEMQDVEISETIKNISTGFAEIYDQAAKAEQMGLKLACGPAYRKSLEFLIKDYVSTLHPDKTTEIKKMLLGACIKTYVNDGRLKDVAQRAVWLGNDETHYERKWEGKDLEDLKNLILLTTHWIAMEELTRKAIGDMPS